MYGHKIPQAALIFWTSLSFTLWWLSDGFRVIPTPVCLNLSAAAWVSTHASRSLLECFGISRQARDSLQSVGLVQFGLRNGSCSVFRFQDVCSQLNLTSGQLQQLATSDQACEVVVDSDYDVQTANTYFAAVWVGGHGPALENIVCGPAGPRNPVWATNIVWTSDGAHMNGFNSSLLVKDATGFNFTYGYTLAVELQRISGSKYVYMELTDCDTYTSRPVQFWEFPTVGRLSLVPKAGYEIQTPAVITSQTGEFLKVAATYDAVQNRSKFFYGSHAIPDSGLQFKPYPHSVGGAPRCVKIGYRQSNYSGLDGTVKMAAVANFNLPEDVVLSFLGGN